MRPIISGVRNCIMSETRLTAMGLPPLCHRACADEGTTTSLMIAQAMVSICAFMIGPPFLRVFFGARPCVVGRPAALVNRQHVCAINSEAGPGIGLVHSDAHTDTPAQTMLSAGDVAPKGARDATLILLREMQHCTDSMKPE